MGGKLDSLLMLGLRPFAVALGLAVLAGATPLRAPLADQHIDTTGETIVDVLEMVPVYGQVAAPVAKMVFVWIGMSGEDPVEAALKEIRDRLGELDLRLQRVEAATQVLAREMVRTQNQHRLDRLRDYSRNIQALALDIANPPPDRAGRKALADKAAIYANAFMEEVEFNRFWEWAAVTSDARLLTDDFSPAPGLTVYGAALSAWIAALEVYVGGNSALVRNYGPTLKRHAAFMATLPGKTSERISCDFHNIRFTPDPSARRGICTAGRRCFDRMSRDWLGFSEITAPGDATSINASCPAVFQMNDTLRSALSDAKNVIETHYGVGSMQQWVALLNRYAETGRLREFAGRFASTPANFRPIWLYAVNGDGDLLWHSQASNTSSWDGPRKVGNGWAGFKTVVPAGGASFFAIAEDGVMKWYRHDGFNGGTAQWSGPKDVGNGWQGFHKVFGAADGVVYGIQPDGTLLWYRNHAADNGGTSWIGPKTVGSGWAQFTHVFAMGEGVIYAVRPDGTLLWYRHGGHADGAPNWTGPIEVGSGWTGFREIVPVGEGILVAARGDGKLFWYKHTDYLTGISRRAPAPAPSGDAGPARRFEPGERTVREGAGSGVATRPSGRFERETVRQQPGGAGSGAVDRIDRLSPEVLGVPRAHWEGPIEVGSGWHGFKQVFAILPGTFVGPR